MVAVAYRNLIREPLSCGGRASAAHPRSRDHRRLQRAMARSLLDDLLNRITQRPLSHWHLSWNDAGKPMLCGADGPESLDASLSHSGRIALVGITDLGNIGVDVEYRTSRRSIFEIASYAFGPEELREVESGGQFAFYKIWTLREALAKACGTGFSTLADGRDYFAGAIKPGTWLATIDGHQWLFSTGELAGDYAVSVAIRLFAPLHGSVDLRPCELP
jgi:phosphopantetheinyl transferase